MDLLNILPWIHIAVSVVLTALILLQSQGEGGLGGAFGGSSDGGGHHTRRGLEKTMFQATVVMGILFALISVLYLFI